MEISAQLIFPKLCKIILYVMLMRSYHYANSILRLVLALEKIKGDGELPDNIKNNCVICILLRTKTVQISVIKLPCTFNLLRDLSKSIYYIYRTDILYMYMRKYIIYI